MTTSHHTDLPLSASEQHTAAALQHHAVLAVVAAYEAFSESRRPDQTEALHRRLYEAAEALAHVVTDPKTAVAEEAFNASRERSD